MLIIGVYLLTFVSIGFLAYEYIPALLRRYSEIQKIQMEKTGKGLDDQVFILTERRKLIRIFTVTPLTLASIGFLYFHNLPGLVGGLVMGFVFPPIITKNLSMRRRNKFHNQLVDGLMILSGALKAGMSLNQAIEVLVEEMPAPMSDEFSLVIRENKMGVALEDCLDHLRNRMPLDDLGLIAIAIGIARETGGNLTEILENLVSTIREKKKLHDRVKALTVQGRLQGYIMMVLPVGFSIFIYNVNPENFKILLTDKLGQMLLGWAIISEIIGIILIQKLSKIEV
jgi:tight adherence protein B